MNVQYNIYIHVHVYYIVHMYVQIEVHVHHNSKHIVIIITIIIYNYNNYYVICLSWKQQIPHVFNYTCTFKSCTMLIFHGIVIDNKVTLLSMILYWKSHEQKFYCTESHLTRSFIVLLVTCHHVTTAGKRLSHALVYNGKIIQMNCIKS